MASTTSTEFFPQTLPYDCGLSSLHVRPRIDHAHFWDEYGLIKAVRSEGDVCLEAIANVFGTRYSQLLAVEQADLSYATRERHASTFRIQQYSRLATVIGMNTFGRLLEWQVPRDDIEVVCREHDLVHYVEDVQDAYLEYKGVNRG